MGRNYKDWLTSYVEESNDGFVPKKFFRWCGLSILASVLERKVWLPINTNYTAFPNIYIMLVAGPGVGKSSAIQPAVRMLNDVKLYGQSVQVLPSQITEAKLIEMLSKGKQTFECNGTIKEQTPYFYYASEASASMKDIFGGFTAILTELYDCNDKFERGTKGDGPKPVTVIKPCVNVLAGSTFDYLHKLIGDGNIMGGFASRVVYIVQKDKFKRTFSFGKNVDNFTQSPGYRKLLQDLAHIQNFRGAFKGTPEFASVWERWNVSQDIKVQELENETMQALLSRMPTLMNKVAMLMCVSDSDDMVLEVRHWEAARAIVEETTENLAFMLREGKARDTKTQTGLNNQIIKLMQKHRRFSLVNLASECMMQGFKKDEINKTLQVMLSSEKIIKRSGDSLELVGDPDMYI